MWDVKWIRMNLVHYEIEVSNLWDNYDLCTNFGSNDILLYHAAFEADIHNCNIKFIKQSDK
jgi:hypothetical protein